MTISGFLRQVKGLENVIKRTQINDCATYLRHGKTAAIRAAPCKDINPLVYPLTPLSQPSAEGTRVNCSAVDVNFDFFGPQDCSEND